MVLSMSKNIGSQKRTDSTTNSQTPNHQNARDPLRRPSVLCGRAYENEHGLASSSDDEEEADSTNSDEYDFVERQVQDITGIRPIPAYQYPNTWSAAYANTSSALFSVSASTSSYLHSLKHSGVAEAGFSIGGALVATANRTALDLTSIAVTGVGVQEKLPSGLKSWLQGKEALDAKRRRVVDAERVRSARNMMRELVECGELIEVEPGRYVDPKAVKSRTGSMVLKRGSSEESMRSGQRGRSARRQSTSSRLREELEKFKIVEGNFDDEERRVGIKSLVQNQNPWLRNSKSNSPISPSPLLGYVPPRNSSSGFKSAPLHADSSTGFAGSSTDASLFPGQDLVESPYRDSGEEADAFHSRTPSIALEARCMTSIAAIKPHSSPQEKQDEGKG